MTKADQVVDGFAMPREAFERLVRAVPDEVVRALVADHVHWTPNKDLIDKLVEKFGP
jgi:hypothetical protein